MNEIKRLKMELHAQLTENIKLNSRARNIFIYDSILVLLTTLNKIIDWSNE